MHDCLVHETLVTNVIFLKIYIFPFLYLFYTFFLVFKTIFIRNNKQMTQKSTANIPTYIKIYTIEKQKDISCKSTATI